MTERRPGRQGPAADPNRDGCGPAALLYLLCVLYLIGAWLT